MITVKRTYNTGSMQFTDMDEFELVVHNISALTAYTSYYNAYKLSGKIINAYSNWNSESSNAETKTTRIERVVVFATQEDYDNFTAETAHLSDDRDAAHASLGWTVTKEVIVG